MDRYAAAGIAADMAQGKRIIVLTSSVNMSREVIDVVAEHAPEASRVERGNGRERITCPSGGQVVPRSVRQGARGLAADIIYIDARADAELRDPDQWRSLQASLAGSLHAEIIRA